MKKIASCLSLILLLLSGSVYASTTIPETNFYSLQNELTISGVVSDEDGEPLIGVSVQLKGSMKGVITNFEGKYTITGVPEDATLVFSYVGMLTQEIPVSGNTRIDVVLSLDREQLEELVVIGYGSQKKVEVTSSVASVKSDEFVQGAVQDAAQLVQGKVAGLNIITPSGDPTANSQILLRGINTIESDMSPLVLIDGIPGDINTVAPEDIESFDVLKDGSAAAIYGTRGTNGVILITTKCASGNMEPTLEYHGYISTQQLVRVPEMLTAEQFREKIAEGKSYTDYGSETDWLDEITRDLPLSEVHNILLRGGEGKTSYVVDANYSIQEGIIIESNKKAFNGRAGINHSMFDNKLRISVGMTSNDIKYRSLSDDGSFEGKLFRLGTVLNPTAPVKDEDGNWFEKPAVARFENPLALIYESEGEVHSQTQRLNSSVIFEPIKDLQFRVIASRSRYNSAFGYSETKNHISTVRDGLNGYARIANAQSIDRLFESTVQYKRITGGHSIFGLAGYSFQDNFTEASSMQNWDFPPGPYSYIYSIQEGSAIREGNDNMINSYKGASNLVGFFGRLSYNYKEKYLLMASMRYEGDSRYVGTEKPWGTFPSISAGWRISEESFMQGQSVVNYLKLRAGYGVTGTAPTDLFLGVPNWGYQGNFLINGEWVPSLEPISNYNPFLQWEVKKEQNFGLDFGLFRNRINGSLDYYIRRSHGMIYEYPVPQPPNLVDVTLANVGVMENSGIELLLNAEVVRSGDFTWQTTMTFSHNNNKLLSLSNDLYQLENDFIDVGFAGVPIQSFTHRVVVDKSIGGFYTYEAVGTTAGGDWLYLDTANVATTDVALENKRIVGNGLPTTFATWNNTFRYKNFDLTVNMRGAFGFQILNFFRMYYEVPEYNLYNKLVTAFDSIQIDGVSYTPPTNDTPLLHSYYLENGNYWKVDNITLGYNIKTSSIKNIKSLRVYASTRNAFILTSYTGMDPEVDISGLSPGNDNRDKYPTTRVFTVGIRAVFN